MAEDTAVITLLRDGDILNRQPVMWGSNGVWLVDLCWQQTMQGRGIYKPRSGEAPLWDFPDGTLYRREYAAYRVACALGWRFVPATVIRTGPLGIGSMQHYIPHSERRLLHAVDQERRDELALIALFDYITNNADRKSAHLLLGNDGHVYGIDHGLCFHRDPKQRTVLAEFFGCPVDHRVLQSLKKWRADSGAVNRLQCTLGELLDAREVDDMFNRLDKVLAGGKIPEVRAWGYRYW